MDVLNFFPNFEDIWFDFDNIENLIRERYGNELFNLVFFVFPAFLGRHAVDIAGIDIRLCDCSGGEVCGPTL